MSDDTKTFKIATGQTRGKVRNRKHTRKWFWERLAQPFTDTSVNFAQYSALDVDQKGEKKAAAGYYKFGHYLEEKRKLRFLIGLWAIQIDIDNVTPEQMDFILSGAAQINRFAWMGHTTRSHFPEKPRWRMVIFLAREVNLDEAHAIARLVSLELADDPDEAIAIPDPVSFRNNQIAYWPSISRNQEYLTHRNDAETLDPDDFLAEHTNWHDVSSLPRQEAEKGVRGGDPNAKMEDPREKPGVIGAFCRAYPISRAIEEFLSDIYTPGESGTDEARYTYEPGTGSNGAVVYDDDTILHSNHGSDPIEGSANAFDLVRIHKFGHLDDKAHGNASPTSLPSYEAMVNWAQDLPEVAEALLEGFGFDDYDDEDDEDEDDYEDEDEDDLSLEDLGLDDLGLDDVPSAKAKKKKEAKEKKPLSILERMNRNHAFVNNGSTPVIADFRDRGKVNWRSVFGFTTEYRNREMQDGKKVKTLANWWLDHPERRTYPLGVVFRPDGKVPKGMFNLWTGWAVEPDESQDCSMILEYIREILANGDQGHYDYILTWLADIVQNPGQKPGVAVVLKGLKGAGKDTIAEVMRRIVGDRHRAKITDTKTIGDKFNAALETALIAHLEEASWGGHMDAKGTLQSYITSPTIRIERKGVDAIELDSFVRLIFTANEDWVVPATADERRYAVFEVSSARKDDKPYWAEFYHRLDSGGAAGFLAFLKAWKKPDYIEIRNPPQTSALSSQKIAGFRGVDLWWFEALYDGRFPGDLFIPGVFDDEDSDTGDWAASRVEAVTADLRAAYETWRTKHRYKAPERAPNLFSADITRLCPSAKRVRLPGEGGRRPWGYCFPKLDTCRGDFALAQNVELRTLGFCGDEGNNPGSEEPEFEIDLSDLD